MAEKRTASLPLHRFVGMAGALMAVRAQETNPERGTRAPVASLDLRCLRNLRVIEQDATEYERKQYAFLTEHAERDKEGNFLPVPTMPGRFHVRASEEARSAAAELEAAGNEVVEYALEVLDIASLDALGPLPRGVAEALEPILSEAE